MPIDENSVCGCWQISVILTTYNSPTKLRKVITSLRQQSLLPMEVVVADDGSTQSVSEVIADFRESLPFPIIHSWQPDMGFRVARSRNLAALRASGNWLLFLDGDCVAHWDLIKNQSMLAEHRHLLFGARKLLSI
jgi:glycosyltransferase involved in cell wall biosynthesis